MLAGARGRSGAAPGGDAEGARRASVAGRVGRRRAPAVAGQRRPRRHAHEGGRPARLVRGRGRAREVRRDEVVPLSELLAAIREGRRYVPVGARGFVRIEETLRAGAGARRGGAVRAPRRASRSPPWPAIRWWAWSRTRRRSRPARASGRCGGACARARASSPRLPPALEAALRPYQKAGVDLDGAPRALGRGRDPGRRDGAGKDRADAGAAGSPGGAAGRRWWWRRPRWSPNWVDEAARFVPELKRAPVPRAASRAAVPARAGPRRSCW